MKIPSILTALILPILLAMPVRAQEKPVETSIIKLVSGDTMTGKVAGIKDDSVNLITDYGVVKIPVAKISEESRKQLKIAPETETTTLKNRVTELEALVATLREENANLRKGGAGGKPTATSPSKETAKTPATPATPVTPGETTVLTYKLSSSGKRHNSRCRYFKSAGEACSATDGEPCKVCGG